MTLQKAILTIEADVDGDGSTETGKFHMQGNAEISPGLRTGYLVGGRGSTANAVFDSLLGDGESRQQGVFLGFGGGTRIYEIKFRGWQGSDLQWGNTGNGGTAADATGEDPLTQIDVLLEYLSTADLDSRNPATLEYGEHYVDGRFEPDTVVPEQPTFTRSAEDGQWFDGSMTLLSAADLTKAWDGQQQTPD